MAESFSIFLIGVGLRLLLGEGALGGLLGDDLTDCAGDDFPLTGCAIGGTGTSSRGNETDGNCSPGAGRRVISFLADSKSEYILVLGIGGVPIGTDPETRFNVRPLTGV